MAFATASPYPRSRRVAPRLRLSQTTCRMSSFRISRRALLAAAAGFPAAVSMATNANEEDTRGDSWWPPKSMKKGFAQGMETGMGDYELAVSQRKRKLFESLNLPDGSLRVLDVGIGTGPNLVYLPADTSCVGLDPNPFMFKYAEQKAAGLVTRGLSLKLLQGDAESIPCDNNSFDAVICTLTLCSVKSPERALSEILRVLRPGGTFLFIEHVCANEAPILRACQTIFNPLQILLADGCRLNRDTGKIIQESGGFELIEIENFSVDLGINGALISRQISGRAVKTSPA